MAVLEQPGEAGEVSAASPVQEKLPSNYLCYSCSIGRGAHWKVDSQGRKRAECKSCWDNRITRAVKPKESYSITYYEKARMNGLKDRRISRR